MTTDSVGRSRSRLERKDPSGHGARRMDAESEIRRAGMIRKARDDQEGPGMSRRARG